MNRSLAFALIVLAVFLIVPNVLACRPPPIQKSLTVTVTYESTFLSGQWTVTVQYSQMSPSIVTVHIGSLAYVEVRKMWHTSVFCAPYDRAISLHENYMTHSGHGFTSRNYQKVYYHLVYHLTITVIGVSSIEVSLVQ